MKELERALNGDFRLVTQGLKQLEREMSDNWDRLLQPSTPTGGHRASSTGFLEITDVDNSPLNLGDKSPPLRPSLDRTSEKAGMEPILTDEADLSWEYPRHKGSNESGEDTEDSSKKVIIFHDCVDATDSEVEELGIKVTTMDIQKGIEAASANVALSKDSLDKQRKGSGPNSDPEKQKGGGPVKPPRHLQARMDTALQKERDELIKENKELHVRLRKSDNQN